MCENWGSKQQGLFAVVHARLLKVYLDAHILEYKDSLPVFFTFS